MIELLASLDTHTGVPHTPTACTPVQSNRIRVSEFFFLLSLVLVNVIIRLYNIDVYIFIYINMDVRGWSVVVVVVLLCSVCDVYV